MSLIITNNKALKDVAIVTISNKQNNLTSSTNGDLTIIKSGDQVVGLNVHNYKNYFEVKEGAHTINQEQTEGIEKLGFKIESPESLFSIGEVISRGAHPKSERLFVLKVKTDKELDIVTNIADATVGSKVVVANVGATLPSGTAIGLSKVMGVESQGTLCGSETLGLEKSDGIYIPDGNAGDKYIL